MYPQCFPNLCEVNVTYPSSFFQSITAQYESTIILSLCVISVLVGAFIACYDILMYCCCKTRRTLKKMPIEEPDDVRQLSFRINTPHHPIVSSSTFSTIERILIITVFFFVFCLPFGLIILLLFLPDYLVYPFVVVSLMVLVRLILYATKINRSSLRVWWISFVQWSIPVRIIVPLILSCLIGAAVWSLNYAVHQSTRFSIVILPFFQENNDVVVFSAYSLLMCGHLYLMSKSIQRSYQSKKCICLAISRVFYYGLNALASIAFPIIYFIDQEHNGPFRLHHSFIGQFLQLLPFHVLQILGCLLSFDALIWICTTPGYYVNYMDVYGNVYHHDQTNTNNDSNVGSENNPCPYFKTFGLDNIIVNHPVTILRYVAIGCLLEFIGSIFEKIL